MSIFGLLRAEQFHAEKFPVWTSMKPLGPTGVWLSRVDKLAGVCGSGTRPREQVGGWAGLGCTLIQRSVV